MFPRIFGDDFWGWLAVNPAERASFDRAMLVGNAHRADRLAALEWRGDETVVDVGGGNGSLLRGLLERVPGLRGIVFDLPETNRDEAIFDERLSFVAGSFSSACHTATRTSSRGSCMTGTTSERRRSCA